MVTRRTGLRTRAANKHTQSGRPTKKKDIKKSGGLRQSSANPENKAKAAAKQRASVRKTGRAVTGSKTEAVATARAASYTAGAKRGGMTGDLTEEGASPGRGRKGRTPQG